MSNIETAILKILDSEELFEKLYQAETLEDAYNFCISVHGGYTLQEFEEFLENIDIPGFEEIDKEINLDKKIDLNEKTNLNNISGGKRKSNYSKALALSLSMVTLASPIVPAVRAAEEVKTQPPAVSKKHHKKSSFWQKYKRYFAYAGVAGSAVALLALCYFIGANWPKEGAGGNSGDSNKGQDGTNGGSNRQQPNPADPGVGVLANPSSSNGGEGNSNQQQPNPGNLGVGVSANPPNPSSSNEGEGTFTKFIKSAGKFVNEKAVPVSVVLSVLFSAVDGVARFSKRVNQIASATWPMKKLKGKILAIKKWIDSKFSDEEIDYRDSQANLEELLKTIAGQNRAKKQIKEIVNKIVHKRNQARYNGTKYNHGDILYFAGPSGVGKTLMAEGLAKYKVLSNTSDVFTISASEVDRESSESVVEQLFGMNRGYSSWRGGFGMGDSNSVVSEPKNLVKYLDKNRNGVVVINEYDKMCTPALDEVIRTINDNGIVNVKGQTIDCSGITIILTSNESADSLGLKGPKEGDNIKEIDRTQVKHDKSFLNRLHIVEFEDLSVEDYVKIIDKEIRNEVVEYWAAVVGMKMIIDDECLRNMAKVVRSKNQGARYIDTAIRGALVDKAIDKTNDKMKQTGDEDYYDGKEVYVTYDPDTEEFTILDEDEKKEDDLKLKKYKEIIEKDILKDFVSNFADRKEGSMDMVIDSKSLENMAKIAKRKDKNKKSRYINVLKKQLLSKAIEKISDKEKETGEKDYYKGKKVHVNYDLYEERFTLVGEDEEE